MATGKVKAGDVFNNWTLLNEDRRNRCVQHFMCKCVYGTTRVVCKDNLGLVQGCGCDRKTYKARTCEIKPRTKKARIVSPKPVSEPVEISHHENQEPRPKYQQRSKSTVKHRNWVYHSVVKPKEKPPFPEKILYKGKKI
jgi:hypothetical protein